MELIGIRQTILQPVVFYGFPHCYLFDNIYWYIVHYLIVSVNLSPLTPTQYLQYVYRDFNLKVPIPWRCITCLIVLTGPSFSKYVHAGRVGGRIVLIVTSVRRGPRSLFPNYEVCLSLRIVFTLTCVN